MNDPRTGGSHGKPHRTPKILDDARRCGGNVAARDARATGAANATPGVLDTLAADDLEASVRHGAFMQGQQELGWGIGRKLRVDTRWAAGDTGRIRSLAVGLCLMRRALQASWWQEHGAAHAGGPRAQQAGKLEARALFAGSQGGTVAPAGGNTCAPRSDAPRVAFSR
jgi:hypothetical protein